MLSVNPLYNDLQNSMYCIIEIQYKSVCNGNVQRSQIVFAETSICILNVSFLSVKLILITD